MKVAITCIVHKEAVGLALVHGGIPVTHVI